jgi:HlyD family secretion protein
MSNNEPTAMSARAPLQTDIQRALEVKGRGLRRALRWGLAVVLLGGAAFGTKRFFDARAKAAETHWVTEPVRVADVRVTVSATGKLQGLNTVEVGAEVTGKVLRVLVDYNQAVKAGQVLAEIDPEQLRAAVEQARAQLLAANANIRTAKATVEEARLTLVRTEEAVKQGVLAPKDVEAARANSERAAANLSSMTANAALASATLKSAESRLEKTKIIAPSAGIVLARYIEPGQTVTAGFTTPVLFKLAEDLSQLSLHVDIDEADVGRVREGNQASFTVDAYPTRTFASKVLALRNDPKTSQGIVTYEAILSVENPEHLLRPGMTATATITSALIAGARVVPNAALRFVPPLKPGEGGASAPVKREEKRVFVLRAEKPTPVFVRTGATDGHVTELASGELSLGDQVLTDAVTAK